MGGEKRPTGFEELVINMLSDSKHDMQRIASGFEKTVDIVEGVTKTIEVVTVKSWEKLLKREDIEIISKTDPAIAAQLSKMNQNLQKNNQDMKSFSDLFFKKITTLEKELKRVEGSQAFPSDEEIVKNVEGVDTSIVDVKRSYKGYVLVALLSLTVGMVVGRLF